MQKELGARQGNRIIERCHAGSFGKLRIDCAEASKLLPGRIVSGPQPRLGTGILDLSASSG